MRRLPIEPLAACLEMDPSNWLMRCHEISSMAVARGCIAGSPIYGHYYGPVSDDCPVDIWIVQKQQGAPIRHGWVTQPGNIIVDPTRWVFEGDEPYVALIVSSDAEYNDYDPGSQRVRSIVNSGPPQRTGDIDPSFKPDRALTTWAEVMLQDEQGPPYTVRQIMWLANLPPSILGIVAGDLYKTLESANYKAAIPVDYWDIVFPNYTDDAFGLPQEHRFLYQRDSHKCSNCSRIMEECLAEECETDVCWTCSDYILCPEHVCMGCDEPIMHKCTYCLSVFCENCDGECECGLPPSRQTEL